MSMQEQEVFLHLGLPKAASSFLQQKVFPKLEGIRYHPKYRFKKFPEILGESKDRRHLFSTEMFGRLEERACSIAERYPDAGIILVLRRQDRWILSKYKYYLWKSGEMDFREFFDIVSDKGYWKQKDLYFTPTLHTIKNAFRRPPLILMQEGLKEDPKGWLELLQKYTSTRSAKHRIPKRALKKSFSERQLILLRAFNKRFPYKKPRNWPRFLKQLHLHTRQGINYLLALSAPLLPARYFKGKRLVPEGDLEAIRAFYDGDWKKCEELAAGPSKGESFDRGFQRPVFSE